MFRALSSPVAQTSKSAVSPISQSAERGRVGRVGLADGARVWEPAIQQTRRSALRPETRQSALRRGPGGAPASIVPVAQVSQPAVSPMSQSAERGRIERVGLAGGARVWEPAIQQTRRSALLGGPSAAPAPIFRPDAETCGHGIVPDVAGNARLLVIIPDPVVIGFGLPEGFFTHTQDFLGAARGELLPRFQYVAQQVVWHGPDDSVCVVGHNDPFVQQIPALVKVPHRVSDEVRDVGPA